MSFFGDVLFAIGFGAVEALVSVPALFCRGLTRKVVNDDRVLITVTDWITKGEDVQTTQKELVEAWKGLTATVDFYRGKRPR